MKSTTYFLIFALSLFFNQLNAKNYYVSTTGKDSNNGSQASPFKTIQKAADVMSAGDVCIIFGGVYRETVIVKDNNVTFRRFDNKKVTVSGTVKLNNWTNYKNGIFKANYSGAETQYTMLFVDFKHQQMARWPNNTTGKMMDPLGANSGYKNCRVFGGTKGQKSRKVTFDNMPSFPNNFFVGGIFRGINGKKWINPAGTITASQGKNLTVNAITKGWIDNSEKILNNQGKGHGFIFHLNALDIANEWFQKGNLVYYKPPAGKNPNNMNIEVKKRKWGFVINNRSGVVIDGIRIHAASIEIKNSSNCKVLNSSVQYMWPFLTRGGYGASYQALGGVYVKGNNNEFKNCYVAHSWGNGFSIESGNNNKIKNCRIEDIGWIAQFTSSIQNNGFNTLVQKSTIGSSGRFHIRTDNKMKIVYNDLYDCMKMGQDAGSIQCTNGSNWRVPINLQGTEIAYNKIHDCTTLTNGQKQFVLAFYLEGCYNYTVHHNLVYNFITDVVPDGTFAYLGPRLSKIQNCYYYNNTVWNVDWGVRIWNRDREGQLENVRFWNNIIDRKSKDNTNGANGILYNLIDFKNNYRDGSANNQNSIFVNVNNGDFRLKQNSPAIDAGRNIPNITTNTTGARPDAGAIEFGTTFPKAGSNINPDIYNTSKIAVNSSKESVINENLSVFPIPADDELYIKGAFNQWEIFSFTGQSVLKGKVKNIDVSNLHSGMYFISVDDISIKFIKN
ncbi:right-handed parallel beta-helix repeat-containing protein [uncultured Algibacter sp.]|uniref:T9SS type A sorting domain-containing protein n=1 Tax=uncultured Algibacter sp. TaxID=298659 RepID=UPI003216AC40